MKGWKKSLAKLQGVDEGGEKSVGEVNEVEKVKDAGKNAEEDVGGDSVMKDAS